MYYNNVGVCVFHINVHTCICMNVFVCAFMHMSVSVHVLVCMHVRTYVYGM